MEKIFDPLTPKLNIHLKPIDGLKMADYYFRLVVYTVVGSYELCKDELIKVDDDNYIFFVDADKLRYGAVLVDVICEIPDANAPGGYRKEGKTFKTDIYIENRKYNA